MATRTTTELILLISFPLFFAFLLPCSGQNCRFPDNNNPGGANKIKGIFVFGSSLVDNGNNNYLPKAGTKSNFLPYGVDFPQGPTGRFTNGKNVIDLFGEKLKLPSIPVFRDPSTKGNKIVHGVNLASGGSGILDNTGTLSGEVTNLNQQIKNFENVTLPDLEAQLGCSSRDSLANYLFVVGVGGNDYTFNYFVNPSGNVVAFTNTLISSLSQQIQKLYSLGARKFLLMTVYPIGCYPYVARFKTMGTEKCIKSMNKAAELFNDRLKSMIEDDKGRQSTPSIVLVNSYKIIKDILANPESNGFNVTGRSCCEVEPLTKGKSGVFCKKGGKVCTERNKYVFFDGLHPTEAVNIQIVNKGFASHLKHDVYPINVQQLAAL